VPTSFTLLPNTTDITTLDGWIGISVQLGGGFIGSFQDGILRPSANTGFWYAFTVSGAFSQAVLLQFLIQPEGVNVQAVGARFLNTTIRMSDDAAFNDAFWDTMTPTFVATTPSEQGYGVPSFSFTVPFILNAFPLSAPAPSTQFRYFRFFVTKTRIVNIQYSEFRLYVNGTMVSLVGAIAEGFDINGNPAALGGGEIPEKAIDNNVSTKVSNGAVPFILVVSLPTGIRPTHFSFITANDVPGRDPSQWTLDVSTNKINWTTAHTQNTDYLAPINRFSESATFPLTLPS
jgi:hypothetical protein